MKADPKQTHVALTWKHSSPLISCRFDPSGKFLFTSAEDRTVQRWEMPSGKKTLFPAMHDSWVRGLAFVDGGKSLVTGGFDGQLMWWPALAEKPQPTRKIQAHNGWVRYLDVSPDGTLLASCGNDNLVKLWNAADGKAVKSLAGHKSNVYSVLFHPDGKHLLSGDLDGDVKLWEIAAGKAVRTFDAKALHTYNGGQQVHYGGVRSMSLSPDKKYLACSGLYKATNPLGAVNEPIVLLFDWKTGKKVHSFVTKGVRGIAWRTIFHPDGYLVTGSGGSGGGYLIFWKPGSNSDFHKLKLPNTARDMDLHKDGVQIATIHYDRQVRISRMAPKPKPPAKKKPTKKK
ncbi:MAG: WD40 repeat domain-containing protein [Planctomycetaceae bacterium]